MITTLETTGNGADAWQIIVGIAAIVFFTGYAITALVALKPPTARTVAIVTGIAAAVCAVALLIDILS